MKKTLLLSVVASTMIMAGGDIAPVEPVVVEEVSSWTFSGEGVAYTQTRDALGANQDADLFSGSTTAGGLGLQLGAFNSDLFAGIGFGAKVAAIGSGNDNGYSYTNFGMQNGYALTEGYLTYGMDSINTSAKVGRQSLPKSLSPFAFSENWQMFQNTFDAALVVNSSIPNTTLVGAWVGKTNGSVNELPAVAQNLWRIMQPGSFSDLNAFTKINDDGVWMLTAQNKSFENLTLTGTWYYGQDHTNWVNDTLNAGLTDAGDTNIWWVDATYAADMFTIAGQGGQILPDGLDDTTAWGAKIAGNLGMFDLMAAYTSADAGSVRIVNLGTDVKTPLYTQSILDQDVIGKDADTFKVGAGMKALGGKFGLYYINADLGQDALGAVMYSNVFSGRKLDANGDTIGGTYQEVDFSYKTKVGENTTLFAAYVYQDDDRYDNAKQNFVRFWARYNFN